MPEQAPAGAFLRTVGTRLGARRQAVQDARAAASTTKESPSFRDNDAADALRRWSVRRCVLRLWLACGLLDGAVGVRDGGAYAG